jgi:anti-sigma factor RsiW
VGAALAAHAGAERGTPALDVASSSAAQVSRWLADELAGVPPIGAEVPPGFRLEGAATVTLPAERAGWVLYRRGAEPVSLFVLPPRTWPAFGRGIRQHGMEFRALDVGRHRVIAWSHPPVSYLLVSARDRSPSEACAVCHAGPDAPALEGFSLARDS